MNKRNKKIITIILILTAVFLYYIGVGIFFLNVSKTYLALRLMAVILPSVLTAGCLALLIQRIIFIRKGE